jgi:uncharacterized RDD family membrane protein YckC
VSSEVAAELSVESVTGIDVQLAVAGAGARSYAFVIDWLIRLTLALAWYVIAAVLYNGSFSLSTPLTNSARWFGAVVLPALAIYFLYHLIVELALRGRTPGKRTAGIRIVSRQGGPPGAGALLVRNVFRLIDSMPGFYGMGLIVIMCSRQSLRFGDMAAGTVLVYERGDADGAVPEAAAERLGALDPIGAEIVADLLQRWSSLEPEARVRLTRQLLRRYLGAQADLSDGSELEWRARLERLARMRQL